ncbi:MAG: IS110 family transposase [Termitinemataceae bacterium]|nr:MAG: IS110 family transposase [Termitinemataceae bacterium]
MSTVYYFGLDVHKDTIQMAVMTNENDKVIENKKLSGDVSHAVNTVLKYHQNDRTLVVAYEAGCMGYTLQRAFASVNIQCLVLPANKVAATRNDKIKTDKRDAELIARMLRRGEAKSIAVPTKEDEAVRDLLRCREDLKEDLKRGKQRLVKFLLRLGYKYCEGGYWTQKHIKWMKGLVFENSFDKAAFEQYYSFIETMNARVNEISAKIIEVAESPQYKERVRHLRAFKGIDYIVALSLVCEIGDIKRFHNAASLMSYLGLVPSEFSSGGKRKRGSITRAGNGHARKLLTESAWHYTHGKTVGKRLEERRKGCGQFFIDQGDKALARLSKKYSKLVFVKGKNKCVAVTAVTRELVGFIWYVMKAEADDVKRI